MDPMGLLINEPVDRNVAPVLVDEAVVAPIDLARIPLAASGYEVVIARARLNLNGAADIGCYTRASN